jgi:hypothetical protein
MKSMVCLTLFLMAAAALAPGAAAAEQQWICTLTDAVECSEGMECGAPYFAGVEPPSFLHVDVEKKVVTLLAPESRRGETNEIGMVQAKDDGWILAGIDGQRAWSLYLTASGYLTLTVTMDGTTWSGFGRCMPASHATP